MKIEKVGSIKINPFDILDMYKFLKGYVKWDLDFYSEYLKSIGREEFGWAVVEISPKFILVPQYRYNYIEKNLSKMAGVKREALNVVLRSENLAGYNVFKIEEGKDAEKDGIESYSLRILTDRRLKDEATVDEIQMVFQLVSQHQNNNSTSICADLSHPASDILKIEEALRALKRFDGVSRRSFPEGGCSAIFENVEFIENTLMVMLNFFYTIYTGYERDEFSKLFDPIAGMLRGFGGTFEDLIKTIKFAITLTG
jgi:hypothetical protein